MINAFLSVQQYDGDDWESYLSQLCLIDIFRPILQTYPENSVRKGIITYIALAYSLESDAVVMGMEWRKNKEIIFAKTGLDKKLFWEDVGMLKQEAVLKSINKWLTLQDSDLIVQLCVLRDLRSEMQVAANSKIQKSSGEVDYETKFKCAQYAGDLKAMIKDLESELIQNNAKLKDAVKEFKNVKTKSTMSVESFAQ